jgi:SpoVK/Ycf46/Vps4 family AAA+-type ATPase
LRSRQLSSNVDLGEVQAVDLADLKGLDQILQSLEVNLILPLEQDQLAQELNLKPKRGVLLAGPPGTGKTTIGRALAHRLKSKFFLIDGTFIAGTGDFYNKIHQVMEAAKQNAPAIVFIDDSDVIFEGGDEHGLYRYLLTLLDGLESETAGRVCIMMTAMNLSNIPPALVRSGRIELWLETSLPDEAARSEILGSHLSQLPEALANAEVAQLVPVTEGMTGADLKRLIEDGKNLYAYDLVRANSLKPATEYFLAAVETVMSNKERYAAAEAQSRQQATQRSSSPSFLQQLDLMQTYRDLQSVGIDLTGSQSS